MIRKKLKTTIEKNVLINSKRRCALCFGLNGDMAIKTGQIAHIDKNRNNDSENNLLFLCLLHHDMYDSVTSQSKNFTKSELEYYRDALYDYLVSLDLKNNDSINLYSKDIDHLSNTKKDNLDLYMERELKNCIRNFDLYLADLEHPGGRQTALSKIETYGSLFSHIIGMKEAFKNAENILERIDNEYNDLNDFHKKYNQEKVYLYENKRQPYVDKINRQLEYIKQLGESNEVIAFREFLKNAQQDFSVYFSYIKSK